MTSPLTTAPRDSFREAINGQAAGEANKQRLSLQCVLLAASFISSVQHGTEVVEIPRMHRD